jgi:hypothetical protein
MKRKNITVFVNLITPYAVPRFAAAVRGQITGISEKFQKV